LDHLLNPDKQDNYHQNEAGNSKYFIVKQQFLSKKQKR